MKQFTLKNGYRVKIYPLAFEETPEGEFAGWVASFEEPDEFHPRGLSLKGRILAMTRREAFQKLRLAIAEEMNPQIRKVRERLEPVVSPEELMKNLRDLHSSVLDDKLLKMMFKVSVKEKTPMEDAE